MLDLTCVSQFLGSGIFGCSLLAAVVISEGTALAGSVENQHKRCAVRELRSESGDPGNRWTSAPPRAILEGHRLQESR